MRRVSLLQVSQVRDPIAKQLLQEIERASNDADLMEIASGFTITGSYTTTRTLNASTATLADVINVLCTLIADCQKGGQSRTL